MFNNYIIEELILCQTYDTNAFFSMGVVLPLISLGHVEFVVAYVDLALVKYALPPNGCVPPHIPPDPNGCVPLLIPLDLVIPINNEVEHPIYETQDPTIIDAKIC